MGDISTQGAIPYSMPHLRATPAGYQLVVNDRLFLTLGAELQNSSFSCPQFMQSVWPKLQHFNVNTVLANVSWEAIEPQEGVFDFDDLDQCISDAPKLGLHLILLWFGAFKNGKSTYVPPWVKRDCSRFPRAMIRKSRGHSQVTDALSIFHPNVAVADASAFAALMGHIRDIDERDSTVIMVQVENEVGLLGDSRDVGPHAAECFNGPVPEDLMAVLTMKWHELHPTLKKNLSTFHTRTFERDPSWPATFGESCLTDELFMAYHYASYVERVARAGKTEYALPMFTNVWQNYADEDSDKSQPVIVGGGGSPGDYPSGGAVINVLDIWQHFAPSLDFIAPDLYLNDYEAVCEKYHHGGQPLFIPEQRRDEYGARRIWMAYGTYHALCASPFGIDTLPMTDTVWKKHFGLLSQVSEHMLAARTEGRFTFGFFFDELEASPEFPATKSVRMGNWALSIERSFVFGRPGPGFGMIIHIGGDRFLLVGEGFQVRFASVKEGAVFTGILSFIEKVYEAHTSQLKNGRFLNGDETRSGEVAVMPNESPDYGDFPICVTIPARTRIAECEVYALF